MDEVITTPPAPPLPRHLSEQALAYLTTPREFTAAPPPSDLADTEGWVRYAEESDALLAKMFKEQVPPDLPIDTSQFELEGVRTYIIRPRHVSDDQRAPIYLDIHGGGLVLGAGEACLAMVTPGAMNRDMITWAVDYRMPPRHPYPAALDDCVAVYKKALEERDPKDLVVGGASAGGNLAPALLLRAKDEGLPMPAALVLMTPEVDLTESGDTFHTLLGLDHMGLLTDLNLLYANGHDLAHPYLSPLFGDVTGFPPTFLISGTRDLFLSNTVRMHRKLRSAGVKAELHIGEAMPHGGFGGNTPEDLEIAKEVRRFLAEHTQA